MSVRLHRGGWEVRWRDASGRQRARRFTSEDAARGFDEAIAEVSPSARRADTARHGRSGGVYSYRTAASPSVAQSINRLAKKVGLTNVDFTAAVQTTAEQIAALPPQ